MSEIYGTVTTIPGPQKQQNKLILEEYGPGVLIIGVTDTKFLIKCIDSLVKTLEAMEEANK